MHHTRKKSLSKKSKALKKKSKNLKKSKNTYKKSRKVNKRKIRGGMWNPFSTTYSTMAEATDSFTKKSEEIENITDLDAKIAAYIQAKEHIDVSCTDNPPKGSNDAPETKLTCKKAKDAAYLHRAGKTGLDILEAMKKENKMDKEAEVNELIQSWKDLAHKVENYNKNEAERAENTETAHAALTELVEPSK